MKQSILPTMFLVALAALVLIALPASAQTTAQHPTDSALSSAQSTSATPSALFTPAPIEQAKPARCGHDEQELYGFFLIFPPGDGCEAQCTTYCQDNGGYLLEWAYNSRAATCECTCCV